jgi:hypothetical protein
MSHPFISAPNTASIELIYQNASEYNENVIHVEKGSPYSFANLQAVRAIVDAWDAATGYQFRHTTAQLVRIRSKALDTNTSPLEDYFLPTPRGGAVGGNAVPLNVAFCVKLATGLAGRSYRGRWYLGNLGTPQINDAGHILALTVAAYPPALDALRAALLAGGHTQVITSYRNNGAWRTTAVNTPVTAAVAVDNAIDSQRRRLPGRGHP